MIKESPRTSKMQEEDNYSLMNEIEQPLDVETTEVKSSSEVKTSYFFIELLICSLLLWSLLFIRGTNYGLQFTTLVKQTLQEEIQNQTVQEMIKEVEEVITQVL